MDGSTPTEDSTLPLVELLVVLAVILVGVCTRLLQHERQRLVGQPRVSCSEGLGSRPDDITLLDTAHPALNGLDEK
jgi:hypothetical protein